MMWKIAERASLREAVPTAAPFMFDGYEVYSSKAGGMGLVLIGRDRRLERDVAIKLWKASGREAEAALLAEAKTLARLSHPNVVTVYGVGHSEDNVYFVMEYVAGKDGHAWIREPHTWQEIRDVFVDAGKGLAAAHDAEIQHRDFKPANMLIGDDGRTRVADFGVADKLCSADPGEVRVTGPAGTPSYMAPERLRGGPGDARSDQFSFCVSLWEALHGMRPYAGRTVAELLDAIETGSIRGDRQAAVPYWLSRVLRRGLSEDPEQRYADMRELVRALVEEPGDELSGEGHVLAPGSGPLEDRLRKVQRSLVALTCGVLGLTVVVAAMWTREPAAVPTRADPTEPREPTPMPEEPSTEGVTPEKVIALIEEGELERAEELWTGEAHRRQLLRVAVHADAIRVGEAFLRTAQENARQRRFDEARSTANRAWRCGLTAAQDLRGYGEPTDAADELMQQIALLKQTLPASDGIE